MSAYDLIMSIFNDEGIETDLEDMLALACKFIDESTLDPDLFEEFLARELLDLEKEQSTPAGPAL